VGTPAALLLCGPHTHRVHARTCSSHLCARLPCARTHARAHARAHACTRARTRARTAPHARIRFFRVFKSEKTPVDPETIVDGLPLSCKSELWAHLHRKARTAGGRHRTQRSAAFTVALRRRLA
jgi:hypothetical protein